MLQMRDEQGVRPELEPIGRGARDQRRRDHGEHHLERHERHRRDRPAGVVDVGQEREVEVADPAVGAAEGDREPDHRPQHADETHREEVLHQHAEHVLRTHHPAVEEREAGGHEGHECCRGEHPGGITCVHDCRTVDNRDFGPVARMFPTDGECARRTESLQATNIQPRRRTVRTRLGADGASHADDQRVTSAFAQVGDAHRSGQLGPAEHAAGVVGEDGIDRPLLRRQVLEGARDLRPGVGWRRGSGAIHGRTVGRHGFRPRWPVVNGV